MKIHANTDEGYLHIHPPIFDACSYCLYCIFKFIYYAGLVQEVVLAGVVLGVLCHMIVYICGSRIHSSLFWMFPPVYLRQLLLQSGGLNKRVCHGDARSCINAISWQTHQIEAPC